MTLGTVLVIRSRMAVDGGGTVIGATITITDPDGDKLIDAVAMTPETGNVFSYIFQSPEAGDEGFYRADVKPTSGAYTGKGRTKFKLDA